MVQLPLLKSHACGNECHSRKRLHSTKNCRFFKRLWLGGRLPYFPVGPSDAIDVIADRVIGRDYLDRLLKRLLGVWAITQLRSNCLCGMDIQPTEEVAGVGVEAKLVADLGIFAVGFRTGFTNGGSETVVSTTRAITGSGGDCGGPGASIGHLNTTR